MEPMIYKKNKGYKILDHGEYKGIKYYIINVGGNHPCAYVSSDIDLREKEGCPAHWGFNFYYYLYQINDTSSKYLGWDYAHIGDYTTSIPEGKKWTTEEIFENVKEVIEWMLKL